MMSNICKFLCVCIASMMCMPFTFAQEPASTACGTGDIELNTNIPFIWRCIKKDTDAWSQSVTLTNAFPRLMWWLVRVVMSTVVIVGLLAVLVWGFMVAAEGAAGTKQKWLDLIKLAVWWLILVGLSGIILNLINPNFFKTNTQASITHNGTIV